MIRNAVKVTLTNKKLCVKVLCFRFITYIIFSVICYFLARATIFPLLQSSELSAVFDTLRGIVDKFFNSNPEVYDSIISTVNTELRTNVFNFLNLVSGELSGIIWSIIGVILTSLVLTFILGVFDYTVGVLVNEHMSSLQHAGFLSTLFENFVPACKYGIYRLTALLLYNVIAYALVSALSVLLLYLIDFFALPIVLLLIISVIVLRQTFAGQTMPNMVVGKMSVWKAFAENFKNLKQQNVTERFISYLTLGLVMLSITVLGAISTFYVSLIITVPLSAVIYNAVKFVDYYDRNNMRYFITYDEIVTPKELRENDEQLLNKVDIY